MASLLPHWRAGVLAFASVAVLTAAVTVGAALVADGAPGEPAATAAPAAAAAEQVDDPVVVAPVLPPEPPRAPHAIVDRSSVGMPWGTTTGLTSFRGNPTRTFYGLGPVPAAPEVAWRHPDQPMCLSESLPSGEEKEWCGTGWTGQPLVWERPDGVTEVIVGAYDGTVRFVDGHTGEATREPFQTGHMVKGTETLDPDGFPLLYTGSRDGKLRVLALDRDPVEELWALDAHPQRVWNDDWDGSPAIVDGVLYVGGEDSWFYAVELHRSLGADGKVEIEPEVILETPGFADALIADVGDHNVSIEGSVALHEGRAYFANSGGRIVGLDVSELRTTGEAPVVFDFWAGDDIDATITIDADGMLYVAVELQRFLPRAEEVGQLLKLDPFTAGDPIVWSLDVPPPTAQDDGGIWATPALHRGVLYVPTHAGDLLAVDAATGALVWSESIGYHEWGSAAVVDDTLVVPLCMSGGLRAYDVTEPRRPRERWTMTLPGGACVESTPAIWDGRIYIGSRAGHLFGLADPGR